MILSALLAFQVAAAPPTPESHLGFRVGQDSMLASWRQITDYFQRLASASPRVRVDTLGRTTDGRPFIVATISDPANLARREQIMAGQRLLADPRLLNASDEARLLREQPAVILINNSIHATEIAASQMSMELAWRLATDTAWAAALRNVVVLIVPSANPDGVDIVGDWYRSSRGTAWDGTGPPWLYHPYVGHDNNRDWFMLTQVETRMLTRLLYTRWFPEVFYDVHQMGGNGARMFVPPFSDPVNPNLDPAIVAGMNLVGVTMAQALHDAGKTGIAHQTRFDLWWHGGARSTPTRHNMVGILSEVASARIASPNCVTASQLREPPTGVNYPAPWTAGCWRLRDIVDYELIASTALVRLAADRRAEFIQRFVDAGRRAIEAGRRGDPAAFILPADSGDAAARAHLANLLIGAGIEVHRATRPITAGGATYAAGSIVVRMEQPFRAHAKDLLERQDYPDRRAFPGGPPQAPYDVAGWTLPLQMGVPAVTVRDAIAADGLERVDTALIAPGRVTGRGDVMLLSNRSTAEIGAVWRALGAGGTVEIAAAGFTAENRSWPAGTLIVRGARNQVAQSATAGGFEAAAVRSLRSPANSPLVSRVPRVGLYRSWNGSMDEGWTRWVFEQQGVTFTSLTDSMIKLGTLRQRYDVIILPSETEAAIMRGRAANTAPARLTGGLGRDGTRALRLFVEEGGTVIALDQASRYAINQLGAGARALRTVRIATEDDPDPAQRQAADSGSVFRFYAPGSIFEAAVDRNHPIASGMGATAQLYFISSTILEAGAGSAAVLSYATGRNPLLSGYVDGWDVLSGRSALIDAPVGRGRAILFGFRPQHRGQTHGTYRLLTNAILYGAASAPVRPDPPAGRNATGR